MRKKKLEQLNQIHGKEESSFQPTTLDQIWGDDGLGLYSTLNEAEYLESLSEMNATDLQRHAIKVGVVPDYKIETTKKRLLSAFRSHVSAYRKPSFTPAKPKSLDKEVRNILSEGR